MALYTRELVRWIAGRPFKIEVTVLRTPRRRRKRQLVKVGDGGQQ